MHSSTVETLVRRDQFVWSFGPDMTPVISVEPGDVVRLETNDCFHGQVRSELDLPDTIDSSLVNAATGPIEVRGAMPGDTLVVELLGVNPGRRGAAMVTPGQGQLAHRGLQPTTRMFDVADGVVRMNERVSFPARPMVGVIGVATDGEIAPTLDAGRRLPRMDAGRARLAR